MISHQDKCLFVHIPKAAGQSVESVFVERAGLTWQTRESLLLRPNKQPELGPPRLAHLTASEYVDLGYISADEFSDYFKFSFVRNPWARLVSEYNYRRGLGDKGYQCDFKTFLFQGFPTAQCDDYTCGQDYFRHVIPQWQFLFDDKGMQLVDFIGKFESLQSDFDTVCQKLGLAPITLPHKNKTLTTGIKQKLQQKLKQKLKQWLAIDNSKPHYSYYYDAESVAFVRDLYQKDIELFGYSFENN